MPIEAVLNAKEILMRKLMSDVEVARSRSCPGCEDRVIHFHSLPSGAIYQVDSKGTARKMSDEELRQRGMIE